MRDLEVTIIDYIKNYEKIDYDVIKFSDINICVLYSEFSGYYHILSTNNNYHIKYFSVIPLSVIEIIKSLKTIDSVEFNNLMKLCK